MGHENFSREFFIHDTKSTKFTVKPLQKIRIELFNFHSKQPIKVPKVNDNRP